MKKLFTTLCIALLACVGASAQKGEMAVGLNLGAAPCVEKNASFTNFGIGAKFQYNVSNPLRLEADVDYWFKSKGIDMFDVTANVQYLFKIGSKVKVYPLVGVGYASVGGGYAIDLDDYEDWLDSLGGYMTRADYDFDDDDDWDIGSTSRLNRFVLNVGLGGEFAVSSKLSLGLEIKYQYIKNFQRLPITIGATYHF